MKATVRTLIGLLIVSTPSSLAWAKGTTKLIVIEGALLRSAVEIADPDIVSTFNIWNGPGVRVNGEPVYLKPDNLARSFIDWAEEPISERPEGLESYEVALEVEGRDTPGNRYTVTYEFDPSTPGGYIFLPRSAVNTAMIWHGVEGNWFRSSEAWERLVRPLVERARIAE